MAHNINEDRMFYFGEVPWHGIGTKLNKPATSEEAIKAAKLDYEVDFGRVIGEVGIDGKRVQRSLTDKRSVHRMDNGTMLGVVGQKYQILQNREAFGFFDSLVGDKLAMYHTAGALGRGEKIWMLAKLPDDVVVKDDVVNKYLVLMNSHDGSSPVKVFFTPVRVVCQNTLTMALHDSYRTVNIRHSGNIAGKIELAREILGFTKKFYDGFAEMAGYLADRTMTKEEVDRYFNLIVSGPEEREKMTSNAINKKNRLVGLFEKGKGNDNPKIRGTAWAAYNAVTEYVDHHRAVQGEKADPSKRMDNLVMGSGAHTKGLALNSLLTLIK